MAKKRILLTGDDGYNSLGTRVLISQLKNEYDLFVVGTFQQQSGVGCKLSLTDGFDWGSSEVDGVPALWVKGAPGDGIELAASYFEDSFDLVISGVNWGANLGTALFSSGTVGAAQRALAVELAPRAIAFSWDLPVSSYFIDHGTVESAEEFFAYPGSQLLPLIKWVQQENYFGVPLININLPAKQTREVRITKCYPSIKDIYTYLEKPEFAGKLGGHYTYTGQRQDKKNVDLMYDVSAVDEGYISVTPCQAHFTDTFAFEAHKAKKHTLD